jgi:hypothetical protein
MTRFALLIGIAGLALAAPASAQGFNIDVSAVYGTPGPGFAAGGAQPGVWTSVGATQGTYPLLSLSGAPTSATITCVGTGSYDFSYNNPGTSGDDQALMDDASDPTSIGATWTINGVAAGDYVLYTYAWAPDSSGFYSNVSVAGSPDPVQSVGGAWSGFYTPGLTHAVHHITVASGGSIGMSISVSVSFATLNGFQLVEDNAAILHCEPGSGSVIACPCGNPPAGTGLGCDNSDLTGGASISTLGQSNLAADTLRFRTSGGLNLSTNILMQGTALNPTGVVFGQGVRCTDGALLRLYIQAAVGGSITVPGPGELSVSAQATSLGDTILSGTVRYYMAYYRDPTVLGGCPSTSTFNGTPTLEVTWQ